MKSANTSWKIGFEGKNVESSENPKLLITQKFGGKMTKVRNSNEVKK